MNLRRLSLALLRVLLWGITLALLLVLTLGMSERGTAFGVRMLAHVIPGFVIEHQSGSLLDLRLARIAWHDESITVTADNMAWTIAPHCLLADRLCITHLGVERLEVEPTTARDDSAPFELALDPPALPFTVTLSHGAIDTLIVRQPAGEPLQWNDVQFSGGFDNGRLDIRRLAARMDEFSAEIAAKLELRGQLPLRIDGWIDWAGRERVQLHADGDLARLAFHLVASGEHALNAEGFIALLGDAPQLTAVATSQAPLQLPLDDPQLATIDRFRLEVSGSDTELQLHVDARTAGTLLGNGTVTGAATWTPEQARISSLVFHGDAGHLEATAELDGARWQAAVEMSDFCPLAWQPELDCRLSGSSTISGTLDGTPAAIELATALAGKVNGYAAAIEAHARQDSDGNWQIPALEVRSGRNQLLVDGSIGATLALNAVLDAPALDELLDGATGNAHATLRAAGTLQDPQIRGELVARTVRWQDHAAGNITLEVLWKGRADEDNRVALEARELLVAATAIDRVAATLDGPARAHRLKLAAQGDGGRLEASCAGALADNGDWHGECATLAVDPYPGQAHWENDRALTLAWDARSATLAIGTFCVRHAQASLCSSQPARLAADRLEGIRLSGRALPLTAFAPWLPEELEARGAFGFDVQLEQPRGGALRLDASVAGSAATLSVPVAGDLLVVELNGFVVNARGDSQRATLGGRLVLQGGASLDGELGIDMARRTIDGTLTLQALEIGRYAMIFPGVLEAGGSLGGTLRLLGPLNTPQLSGTLRLADAHLAHERLPQPIDEATLTVDFSGDDARIEGLVRTGSGGASLDGSVHFADGNWSADLALHSAGLQIEPLRGSSATIAPELRLQLSQDRALLSGEIRVPRADIRLDELPQTAISRSPYAVVVGEEAPATPFAYGLDVRVQLGQQVRLRGMGLDTRLEGALAIVRDADEGLLRGRGEIRTVDGRYKAYGQDLEITEGRIRFRGALDRPDMNLTAIRRIEDEDVQVGIRVRGDLREPQTSVFSRPAMEETIALYYLLTGHRPDDVGNTDFAVTGMLMQLGLAGASRVTGAVASRFGIQDFQVGARQVEGGTEVQLSGYLSPDLYLRYGVSTFDRINTVRLRYRLRGSFYLEAISGIENAIDFLYSFER